MTTPVVKWVMLATMIVGFSALGRTEEIDAGKAAYLSSCAACHGEDAKGNGVLSPVLKVPPAKTIHDFDLSQEPSRKWR